MLRPAQQEDLQPLHEIFSDPRAMRYWDRPPHANPSVTQRVLDHMLAQNDPPRAEFVLIHQGKCVGKAGVHRLPEIGYILHPDLWGQGLVSEALDAIVPHVFALFPDIPELTAEIDPRNTASRRVLEKLGFRQTGYAEKNFLYDDTEWCDTAYFALPRPVTPGHGVFE